MGSNETEIKPGKKPADGKKKKAPLAEVTGKKGVIKVKMGQNSEAAYRQALSDILGLMDSGFTHGYRMKFKPTSKVRSIPGMPKTKAQLFWNACARHETLWPLMKQYVSTVVDSGDFYGSGKNEEHVPSGGYATYALGLADLANWETVEEFMAANTIDPDNSTPSIFTACFIEKFGINALTAREVVASIAGSSNTDIVAVYPERVRPRLDDPNTLTVFDGLDDPATVVAIADAMKALKLRGDAAKQVVCYLYGDCDSFERLLATAEGPLGDALAKIENRVKKDKEEE